MIAEPLSILLLAVATTASPPATPDDCRADITTAWTRWTLVAVTDQMNVLAEFVRAMPDNKEQLAFEGEMVVRRVYDGTFLQKRTIDRCIEDKWPSLVTRCYLGADSIEAMEACARSLPQAKCLALEQATRLIDHDPGGRCGEPPTRYF